MEEIWMRLYRHRRGFHLECGVPASATRIGNLLVPNHMKVYTRRRGVMSWGKNMNDAREILMGY